MSWKPAGVVTAMGAPMRTVQIRPVLTFIMLAGFLISASPCASPGLRGSIGDEFKGPTVVCTEKLGLAGTVTSNLLVEELADGGSELVFVGTSDGLYVISEGSLIRYVYTPFGISHVAAIDDVTGDGNRDIVISLGPADVASIRAYDGVTWEEIWQFAPRQPVFVDRMGWSELQLPTTDMKVIDAEEVQVIAISTGEYVFGVDSRDGKGLWLFEAMHELSRLAEVGDMDDDGTSELVVGDSAGYVYMLGGRGGQVHWKRKVSEDESDERGTFHQFAITDVAGFETNRAKAVAAAADGKISLIDLQTRDIEWTSRVFLRGKVSEKLSITITLLSNPADGGYPGILAASGVNEGGPGFPTSAASPDPDSLQVALIGGADGNLVWLDELYLQGDSSIELGYRDGQAVIPELGRTGQIQFVAVETGQVAGSMNVTNYSRRGARVTQLADYGYLVVSDDSGLDSVSASGTML